MPEENKLIISPIFKWYRIDFGGRAGALNFIERYLVDNDKKEFIMNRNKNIQVLQGRSLVTSF